MSRTDNTMPFRIQKEDRNDDRRRYPPHWGGIYKGIGRNYLRKWWRAERNKVKITLKKGIEPEPTRPRNFCKWDYW